MNANKQRKVHAEGKFLRFVEEKNWEYVERTNCTGIVVIVARTPAGEVLLTEQYRIPVHRKVIEFPAGLVNDRKGAKRESLEEAAKRELLEETGYAARGMRRLVEGPATSGLSSEVMTFLLATGLRRVGDGGGDGTESIVVHRVPLKKLERWLKAREKEGLLIDPKIFTGLYFLK